MPLVTKAKVAKVPHWSGARQPRLDKLANCGCNFTTLDTQSSFGEMLGSVLLRGFDVRCKESPMHRFSSFLNLTNLINVTDSACYGLMPPDRFIW
jgi:hypothetical protein